MLVQSRIKIPGTFSSTEVGLKVKELKHNVLSFQNVNNPLRKIKFVYQQWTKAAIEPAHTVVEGLNVLGQLSRSNSVPPHNISAKIYMPEYGYPWL